MELGFDLRRRPAKEVAALDLRRKTIWGRDDLGIRFSLFEEERNDFVFLKEMGSRNRRRQR